MKAPNKIYINNYNGNDTWGSQWHTKPATDPITVSHKYVRAEAIMEWADEQEKELEYGIAADAYKLALDMLREKLNSL